MLTIKQVEPLADYRLRVHLSNGKVLEPCIVEYLDAPCYEGLLHSTHWRKWTNGGCGRAVE